MAAWASVLSPDNRLLTRDGIHLPRAGDALQLVRTAILETEVRANHQILDCLGHEDLGWGGHCCDSRADVHGKTSPSSPSHGDR